MTVISVKQFIEAGVHFGHRTHRWSPKMSPYIMGIKNGIHVIDLKQSLQCLKKAHAFVREQSAQGKQILFVATKNQAREIIETEAKRCGAYYINERWLGGLMTNFSTVKQSVVRLKKLEQEKGEDGSWNGVIKKEAVLLEKQLKKLEAVLGGIKQMRKLPQLLFVIDCQKERLALQEATRLKIPIVAVVDTNCNPCEVDYPIPGNDDAIRAIQLYSFVISSAVLEGKAVFEAQQHESTSDGDKKTTAGTTGTRPVSLSDIKNQVTQAKKAAQALDKTAPPAKNDMKGQDIKSDIKSDINRKAETDQATSNQASTTSLPKETGDETSKNTEGKIATNLTTKNTEKNTEKITEKNTEKITEKNTEKITAKKDTPADA